MAITPVRNVPTVKVSNLRLSEDVFDTFSERAIKKGHEVETEIRRHLEATKAYNASAPIYLDDEIRNTLSQLAGRSIASPADLVAWARRLASLQIGEVHIELDERLATRLDTRRFGKAWPDFLRCLVTESLEEKVGMR